MVRFLAHVRGGDKAIARLRELSETQPIADGLDRAAALVEREAVKTMPVDSGQMRSSMYVDAPEAMTRVVGNPTRQAVFTEYSQRLLQGATPEQPREGPWPYQADGKTKGTKRRASMPWLRSALLRNRDNIRQLLLDALRGRKAQ